MEFTICTLGNLDDVRNKNFFPPNYTFTHRFISDQIEDSAHEILLSSSVTPIVTFNSTHENGTSPSLTP